MSASGYVVVVRFADAPGPGITAGVAGPYADGTAAGADATRFTDRGYRTHVEPLFDAAELLGILDRLDALGTSGAPS